MEVKKILDELSIIQRLSDGESLAVLGGLGTHGGGQQSNNFCGCNGVCGGYKYTGNVLTLSTICYSRNEDAL